MEVLRSFQDNLPAQDRLRVGLSQIAPIWLNRDETLKKIETETIRAAEEGCQLVTFGEALLPGYPFWLDRTGGARFNDPLQKEIHGLYLDQGVIIERGDLDPLCAIAKTHKIAIYLGVMERAPDRGGHTLYCSLVYIAETGEIGSVHRKLQPTYEERLVWGPGDGHGLRVHPLGPFTVGGLNCWENWMPLARASLYGQGENLHISVWPGGLSNTHDLPQVLAKEGRSYVIATSGLMRREDVPQDFPGAAEIIANSTEFLANGGSCLVAPDGSFVVPPQTDQEVLIAADIDMGKVREERQNFDPAGHYSRPDVTHLNVNRARLSTVKFEE